MTRLLTMTTLGLLALPLSACVGTADTADRAGTGGMTADNTATPGSGGSDDNGNTQPTGGNTGEPGGTCRDGETTDDGCNTCTCTDGAFACTKRACLDPACDEGATRPAPDGCNTCTCLTGAWACTERACVEPGEGTACGARAGDTCSETEYCAYEAGAYCGAADAEATCQPRPEICTGDYTPVCGCDGKDYSNKCGAAAAGTGVLNEGTCSQ